MSKEHESPSALLRSSPRDTVENQVLSFRSAEYRTAALRKWFEVQNAFVVKSVQGGSDSDVNVRASLSIAYE